MKLNNCLKRYCFIHVEVKIFIALQGCMHKYTFIHISQCTHLKIIVCILIVYIRFETFIVNTVNLLQLHVCCK